MESSRGRTPARVHPLLLCALLFASAPALPQGDEPETSPPVDPGAEPVVNEDVPDADVPELSSWDFRYNATVQYDVLANSGLPSDREKSSELRRARLGGYLEFGYDWRLKAAAELSDGAELRDLSLEWRGTKAHIELGRFVEPFGLLQSSSSNLAFMERPQASALAPGYGIGIAANFRGRRWGLTLGTFKATRNDEFFGGRKEDALTMRLTLAPYRGRDSVVHLGGAISRRISEDGFVRFVAIPESVLLVGLNTSSAFLETTNYDLFGLEFATLIGPTLVQAEYMRAEVNDFSFDDETGFGFAQPTFASWYLEAAWAITGERREYSTRRGTFSGITPRRPLGKARGHGAFEVAARYSDTDLLDPEQGGEHGKVRSIGLNWYPTQNWKLMLEQLRVEELRADRTRESVSAVQMRLQWRFAGP